MPRQGNRGRPTGHAAGQMDRSIDRFGKEFEGYRQVKSFFYDLECNEYYLEQQRRTDALYMQQPRRTHCKICRTQLGEVLFTLGEIDFHLCPNCEHLNGAYQDTAEFCEIIYGDSDKLDVGPKNHYEDADKAAYRDRANKIYKPKADYLIEILTEVGEDPWSLSYADLGAGCGHLIYALLEKGITRVRGYDVSPLQVAQGNSMNGREVLELHRVADTATVAESLDVDVVTSIFQLEHVEDPTGLCRALAKNPNIRYMLLAVPVFSVGSIVQATFPNVMPRILGLGHTHLFSEKSLQWLLDQNGFHVLSRWWFGSDAFDLHRSISIHLQQEPKLAKLAEVWDKMLLPAIDQLQLALDERRSCSEVHLVVRVK